MAEYIDKEELYQYLDNEVEWNNNKDRLSAMEVVFEFQAADVATVKHGKWIWNPNGMDWGLGAWECSECACRNSNLPMDNKINPLVFSGSKYCPHCGAKMDL